MSAHLPYLPRGRWLVVFAALAVGVASGLGWLVLASSLLAVRGVEVSGLHRLSRPDVIAVSGIGMGTPLAVVDIDRVRQRVTGLRVAESAEVQREWPTTVRIVVNEREPVAAVPKRPGYALLDADGVLVDTVARPPARLPVVRIAGGATASGGTVGTAGTVDRAALRVLDVLPRQLGRRVSTVRVTRRGEVTLELRGGATVIWGRPGHAREKMRILGVLLRRDDAETYDVSSLEVVTTG